MSKGFFCPRCGKEKGPFVKGLCKDCWLERNDSIQVPDFLEIEFCKKCGKVRLSGKWVEQSERVLSEFVKKKIKLKDFDGEEVSVSIEPVGEKESIAFVEIKGRVGDTDLELEKEVLLKPKTVLCDPCMRLTSNYHEAILQVRYAGKTSLLNKDTIFKEIESLLERERAKDPLAGVAGIKDARNGFDVLIGSSKAGKKVAQSLAAAHNSKVVSSFKTIGVDKAGKEKKRFTYCVRV